MKTTLITCIGTLVGLATVAQAQNCSSGYGEYSCSSSYSSGYDNGTYNTSTNGRSGCSGHTGYVAPQRQYSQSYRNFTSSEPSSPPMVPFTDGKFKAPSAGNERSTTLNSIERTLRSIESLLVSIVSRMGSSGDTQSSEDSKAAPYYYPSPQKETADSTRPQSSVNSSTSAKPKSC